MARSWWGALLAAMAAAALVALIAMLALANGDEGTAAGPRLALEDDSFDLGEVAVGETVQRSVEFVNEGDAPLEVTIVKVRPAPDATCGCGVEGFRVEPASVPVGGSGRLLFDLNAPEGMERMTDKMLAELESNDPAKPDMTITLIFGMGP